MFQLESDADNWCYFKMFGTKLVLKKDVVPHKNLSKKMDSYATSSTTSSQLTNSAKKRKQDAIESYQKPHSAKRLLFKPSESVEELIELAEEPAECSEKNSVVTKNCAVQVNIKKKCTSVGVLVKATSRSIATSPMRSKHRSLRKPLDPEVAEEVFQPFLSSWTSNSSIFSLNSTCDEFVPSQSGNSGQSKFEVHTMDRKKSTMILLEQKSRFYLGLPPETYNYVTLLSNNCKVPEVNILLCLKKIRQNDAYERLADDFSMSSSNVQRMFTSTIPQMANVVQQLIFWPEPVAIRKTLPIAFRYRYRSVQSIIDCFDIEIEKPSNPVVQSATWSEYKKCNTFKFLISSTPGGLINFISIAYGGRITDKQLFENSGYLDIVPIGSQVLADRGFKHVAALLTHRSCELIRPPSVSEGQKLSKPEVKKNREIAALRVHIERVIRRLREFKMLAPHACLHHSFWPLLDNIVVIACSIVNVQGPLSKK